MAEVAVEERLWKTTFRSVDFGLAQTKELFGGVVEPTGVAEREEAERRGEETGVAEMVVDEEESDGVMTLTCDEEEEEEIVDEESVAVEDESVEDVADDSTVVCVSCVTDRD